MATLRSGLINAARVCSHSSKNTETPGDIMENGDVAAPNGFIQLPDPEDPERLVAQWRGPTYKGDGWQVETTWTPDGNYSFRLASPDGGDARDLSETQHMEGIAMYTRVVNTYRYGASE